VPGIEVNATRAEICRTQPSLVKTGRLVAKSDPLQPLKSVKPAALEISSDEREKVWPNSSLEIGSGQETGRRQ
jgi:hypothetical protein